VVCVLILFGALPGMPVHAQDAGCHREDSEAARMSGWRLQSHEPNMLGYTWDESGQFMDFTVSVRFTVFEKQLHRWIDNCFSTQIAFTGRLGQYLGRGSSPVIGKRFNPEWIMARYDYSPVKRGYYEFSYAHESNGQRITDLASYQQTQTTLEKPQYADDYISRGWDFLRLTLYSPEDASLGANHPLQGWVTGKWFLKHGLLQGTPEEYNSWENDPEGKPRKEVDGLSVGAHYRWATSTAPVTGMSAAISATTGYRHIFRYNTVRGELGFKLIDVPVILWAARGYNADLVRYYNKTNAIGIAVVIGGYLDGGPAQMTRPAP
jgi:hypothetical protein